jgi:hypothetical protein
MLIRCRWLLPIWISESGEQQQQYILKECGGNVMIWIHILMILAIYFYFYFFQNLGHGDFYSKMNMYFLKLNTCEIKDM